MGTTTSESKKTRNNTPPSSHTWDITAVALCNKATAMLLPPWYEPCTKSSKTWSSRALSSTTTILLSFSDTYDEHVATLRKVLQRLLDEKFWLKASKCQFFTKRLDILVHILTPDGLHVDPKKRKKVLDFKVPSNHRELRGILGVVIFLSKFYPELASWSSTLSELQGENARWRWTDTDTIAREKIKELTDSQTLGPFLGSAKIPGM